MLFCESPSHVRFLTPAGEADAVRSGNSFEHADAKLTCRDGAVTVSSLRTPLLGAVVTWDVRVPADALVFGDDWERSYASLGWRRLSEYGAIPWYFLCSDGSGTAGWGVAVRPSAMCSWTIGEKTISLHLDLRCGCDPVELRGRTLKACTVVTIHSDEKPFAAARAFCLAMCADPRLPREPIYGGNDWYCCYGDNSYGKIVTHAKRVAECSPKGGNRPYMVVDDGWELCRDAYRGFIGGPWLPNRKFGDMRALASEISALGVKPGLWIRPLQSAEFLPDGYMESDSGRHLDPSSESALSYIKEQVERVRGWGFRLLKHDFTTYDITGKYGPALRADMLGGCGHFSDKSRTTAEIVLGLYRAIREAAGDMTVLGCDVIGHLSAGFFEAQRTGDDTSGREWERTVAMGVNTLAYRLPQHGAFFAADADCVGITKQVPWERTAQWLDLLSVSGTPLFASIAEDAYDGAVREALTAAFGRAASPAGTAEPLDWIDAYSFPRRDPATGREYACMAPEKWLGNDKKVHSYRWF